MSIITDPGLIGPGIHNVSLPYRNYVRIVQFVSRVDALAYTAEARARGSALWERDVVREATGE